MPAVPKPARGSHAIQLIKAKAKVRREVNDMRRLLQSLKVKGPTAQRRAKKGRAIVDAEKLVKDEVKRLDGYRCRWPGCEDATTLFIPLDACHYRAEGIGGDPTLARCTLENLITLHRRHHVHLHQGLARMRPLNAALGMRGPVEFEAVVPGEAGKWYVVGTTEPPKVEP